MNYTCTTTGASQPPITPEAIKRVQRLLESAPPCPLTQWMVSQGADPAHGWLLVLPESMRADVGPFPPTWGRFSSAVSAPVMMRRGAAGIATD